MSGSNHPNILKCLDSMTIQGDLVIITEFAQYGDLWHYMIARQSGGLSHETAKTMFCQIMEGLSYLHAKNVVHRDLKTLNILVFEDNQVKIADFGNSKQIPITDQGYVDYVPCTPTHIAPEAIQDEEASEDWILGKPCDIYSAGVCLYEMLSGKEPFETKRWDMGHEGLYRRVRRGDLQFDDDNLWGGCKDLAMHLVARMMNLDPTKRPTAEQVLIHPWLAKNPGRESLLKLNGLRLPHSQKPEAFSSSRPDWITPRPRTRRGDHSYSETLEEIQPEWDSPPRRTRRVYRSFSEEMEDIRKTTTDWIGAVPPEGS